MDSSVAVGIDLGGTNLKVAVVEHEGRIRAKRTCPIDAAHGPDPTIDRIVGEVDAALADASLARADVIGVGIGTPGPLNIKEGRIIHAANLPGWEDVPIRDRLHDTLQLPVTLDNDGNAAAFGEFWVGAGRGTDDLVMLTLGTGVGGGIVSDGRLVHGHFDNAAELGHMIVVSGGLPCSCGQRGCLEQYASAGGVARRVVAAMESGESCALGTRMQAGESIDAADVVGCAEHGDPLCLRIWEEACLFLSIACINIQHVFNPMRIVLGGGMSRAGTFLLDRVRANIQERSWSLHNDLPTVTLATLGYDAGVIGAAGLAWQRDSADRRAGAGGSL
ncbi:MAG: ROK family protein [Planctomycetota bacterium]